jgi:hypothetical protein
MRRGGILLILLACLGACDTSSRADSAPSPGALVESKAPRWSAAEAWRLDSVPQVRIGEADGAPEHALSNVVGAARLSDGRIVVANRETNDLRYYDAQGKHVRTAGRKGDGPGEFRFMDAIGTAGDTVLVWDAFARRVSRFDGRGDFAGSTPLAALDLPFPVLAGFLADGSMLIRPRGDPEKDESREGEYVDSVTYLRFSARTGARIGALGPYLGGELFLATANRNWMSGAVIFGKRGMVAPARQGFYRAESDRFQATFHAPDGTPVRTVGRPHEPVRATAADVAAGREALQRGDEEILRMAPDMAAAQRRLAETITHRSTLPAISQLRVDRADNLWIQAYVPPDASVAEWSVFDPQGRWLGVVEVPATLEVLEIGEDWLLAKAVDPHDGVERVVVHRLRKPG